MNDVERDAIRLYSSAMLIIDRQLSCLLPAIILSVMLLTGCGPDDNGAMERLESFKPYKAKKFLQQIYELDAESAASLLKQHPDTMIIDVRGVDDFNKERLPGALCYDQSFAGFSDEMSAIDRDKYVLLYGNATDEGGMKVSLAVQTMKDLGFKTIYYLGFGVGIEGWKESGQPYETGY